MLSHNETCDRLLNAHIRMQRHREQSSMPKYCSIVTFYCFCRIFLHGYLNGIKYRLISKFLEIISIRKCCLVDAYACNIDLVIVFVLVCCLVPSFGEYEE